MDAQAAEINRLHLQVCAEEETTLEKRIRIGELLSKKKTEAKGKYRAWLEANVKFDKRTAQRYIEAYVQNQQQCIASKKNKGDTLSPLSANGTSPAQQTAAEPVKSKPSQSPTSKPASKKEEKSMPSDRTDEREKLIQSQGTEELKKAREENRISAATGAIFAKLPKELQDIVIPAITAKIKPRKQAVRGKTKPTKSASRNGHKPDPNPEDEDRKAKWLATINAPSTFPVDAPAPKGNGSEEVQVRAAIEIARENESQIATLGKIKLHDLIWVNTMCIQGYHENRHNRPRPNGPLDNRLNDWAKDVARKHQARTLILQTERLSQNGAQPKVTKPRSNGGGFDKVFRRYWLSQLARAKELRRMYPFDQVLEKVTDEWFKLYQSD